MTGAGGRASKLGRYLEWFAEAQLAAWTVLGLLAAVAMVVCHAGSELAFRLAGLWLQLMGVLMTALGFYALASPARSLTLEVLARTGIDPDDLAAPR